MRVEPHEESQVVLTHVRTEAIRSVLGGEKTVHRTPEITKWLRGVTVGDVVVFKEPYFRRSFWDSEGDLVRGKNLATDVRYLATDARPRERDGHEEFWEFRESIYLPKFAWRCFGVVEMLSRERLHDVTHDDAEREGVKRDGNWWAGGVHPEKKLKQLWPTARRAFQRIWDSSHGEKPGLAWADNPEVVRVEFRTIERAEVDALGILAPKPRRRAA